jgi:hypothetical protein
MGAARQQRVSSATGFPQMLVQRKLIARREMRLARMRYHQNGKLP